MMNITSPRRVGHRVVRRAARPQFSLQPISRLPVQTPTSGLESPARPLTLWPNLWQRLRQWLWPRLTPEQWYTRSLERQSADLLPRVVVVGGHPFLLTPSEPTHAHARRAQSDLP